MGEVEREEGRRAQALQSPAWVCDTYGETYSHANSSTVPQAPRAFPGLHISLCGRRGKEMGGTREEMQNLAEP